MNAPIAAMQPARQGANDAPEGFDPRDGAVKTLEEQKLKLMAEFQARMNEIDRQISQFTAITNEVAA